MKTLAMLISEGSDYWLILILCCLSVIFKDSIINMYYIVVTLYNKLLNIEKILFTER